VLAVVEDHLEHPARSGQRRGRYVHRAGGLVVLVVQQRSLVAVPDPLQVALNGAAGALRPVS